LHDPEFIEQAEIQVKYASYVQKEEEMASKMHRLEEVPISASLDFRSIRALSAEAREKLTSVRPRTVGQAARISGVSPADISILLVQLGR
jgi:tRNA uridine 5-carboxymethylaminomethyl modification enzyme